jgi:hypothetical protein
MHRRPLWHLNAEAEKSHSETAGTRGTRRSAGLVDRPFLVGGGYQACRR